MKKLLLSTLSLSLTLSFFAQVPAYVPSTGLVAWLPFSGNASDLSGSGNNGTLTNGALYTSDRFSSPNSAVQLDGVNDYINLPSGNTSLNITGNFSVSYWLLTSDASGLLASLGDNVTAPPTAGGYLSGLNGGSVGNGIFGVATRGNWNGTTNTINNSLWRHIVYTFSGGTLKIYIDNILNTTIVGIQSPLSWSGSRVIGCRNDLVMGASTNYSGKFDDMAVYNRALTHCEVQDLFNSQVTVLAVSGGANQILCEGNSTSLSGNGASTYSWDNGVIDGTSFVPSVGTTTYTVTGTDGAGCTGQDQVMVTANANTSSSISPISCDSYSAPDGQVHTLSGNYIAVIQNALGCDSTITIDLTVNYSNSGIDVVQACDSYTWIDGNNYTASNNTATYMLTNLSGCDSLVTLDLSLDNSSSSTLNETALDFYTLNGQTYNQSGTYTQTIPNEQGCDSTITLNLSLDFTGIEENTLNSIEVYPNPANESIVILSNTNDEVIVMDLLGNNILTEKKDQEMKVIDISGLPSGTYFIRQAQSIIKFTKN